MKRDFRLAGVRADVFGSAAAAIRGHGNKPRPNATAGAAGALVPDASFMAQLDAHFTALSAAAAGSNVVQESLAAASTTQYSAIISKLEALEALYVAPSGGGGGGRRGGRHGGSFTSDDRAKATARINQLQAAIRGSWITGPLSKFCSTHGWGWYRPQQHVVQKQNQGGRDRQPCQDCHPLQPRQPWEKKTKVRMTL